MYDIQYTLYSVQCTIASVQCTASICGQGGGGLPILPQRRPRAALVEDYVDTASVGRWRSRQYRRAAARAGGGLDESVMELDRKPPGGLAEGSP